MSFFDVLYRDDHYIAVNKPSGYFVHRSKIDPKADYLLGHVRNLVGRYVWPIHRIDRPTSGIVVFALSKEAAGLLCCEFREKRVDKKYIAVVRGFIKEDGVIDYPICEKKNSLLKPAVTKFKRLKISELPFSVGRYSTCRFSLVEVYPVTGRFHQIRKHFAHIYHPVICDSTHGDGKQNAFVREHFKINRLLLAASELCFLHPYRGVKTVIKSPVEKKMSRLIDEMFV